MRTCRERNWVDDRPPKKTLKEKVRDKVELLQQQGGVSLGQGGSGGVHSTIERELEAAEQGRNDGRRVDDNANPRTPTP